MKIALIGYGKMGKMIEQIAKDRGHDIVSIIDIDNQQDFDSEAFASADVAIEFTAPQAAYGNYLKAWAKGVTLLGVELLDRCGDLLGRQPLPGGDHEPIPSIRRGDGGDPSCA